MFENELQTRAAICGAGILLAAIFLFAHLPLLALAVPVGILFLGIVADPEETHAVWYGMLNTLGIFDFAGLSELEKAHYAEKKHYFWFGEVAMAAALAGVIAVPCGIFLVSRAEATLACAGTAIVFLPLFIVLPKLFRKAAATDPDTIIAAFGKNEHIKKIFWAFFAALAGIVLAQVVDPATAAEVVRLIAGTSL